MEVALQSKLNTLRELSRLKLAAILTGISGFKDLVIEQNVLRSMEKICGAKWLKLYDIEKMYKLEDNMMLQSARTQVFLIPSSLLHFKRVTNILEQSNTIENKEEAPAIIKYHIIVIPRILNSFEELLEESGLCGYVQVHSFMWQFLSIDKSLLSLELPNLFNEIYVENDLSLLTSMSKNLYFLFDVVGKPNVIIPIGKHAHNVLEHFRIFEENLGTSDKSESDFGALVIMDRTVDFLSALLTNVTYTGMLNEVYRINGGVIEERFNEQTQENNTTDTKFTIDNKNDTIYLEIKNRHISEVSDILGTQTKQLKSEGNTKGMEIEQIKMFVQTKLQSVTKSSRYLSFHLQACEKIISDLGPKFERLQFTERSALDNANKSQSLTTIEDYIITENQFRSLRLFCLLSLTQKLTWDEFNNLKLQYLQEHGYKFLYIFQNLINCGLMLKPQSRLSALSLSNIVQKKDFYSNAYKLKLIPPKPELINIRSPTCPSYVFGGNYIPVIAQFLSLLIQAKKKQDIQPKLEILGGSIFTTDNLDKYIPLERRTILVFVIGGLTYAEIAACNLVEKLFGCTIVLSSNCLISGNDLVGQCF